MHRNFHRKCGFSFCALILVIVLAKIAGGQGEYGCERYVIDGAYAYCFDLYNGTTTLDECEAMCQEEGSGLPTVISAVVNDVLRDLVDSHDLLDIWLGAKERRHTWRWSHDGREVAFQGCHKDSSASRQFDVMTVIPSLTRDKCQEHCNLRRYNYYALQSGGECWCSVRLDSYTLTNDCTTPCTGDGRQYCGGLLANQAYAVHGSYVAWDTEQPNNHHGYQSCVVIDHENDLGWNDAGCREYHSGICQFDLELASCTASNHVMVGDLCLDVATQERGSWYDWVLKCSQWGGYLAQPDSAASWAELREYLAQMDLPSSLWLGLTNRQWRWKSGLMMRYHNWAPSKPNGEDQQCAAMDRDGYWDDVICSSRLSCVCQRDNVTRPTTTAAARTLAPRVLTTPLPPAPPTDPIAATVSLFDQYIKWALVGGAVLVLTIIIAVCACCIDSAYEKNRKAKVQEERMKEEIKKSTQYYGMAGGDLESARKSSISPGAPELLPKPDVIDIEGFTADESSDTTSEPCHGYQNGHVPGYENVGYAIDSENEMTTDFTDANLDHVYSVHLPKHVDGFVPQLSIVHAQAYSPRYDALARGYHLRTTD